MMVKNKKYSNGTEYQHAQLKDVQRNELGKFEFDNMFSYGENNLIYFTKLNGIIGMFGLYILVNNTLIGFSMFLFI